MTDDVVFVRARVREHRDGKLYLFTDSRGVTYATRNMWLASLCQHGMETGKAMRVDHRSGWYYRELQGAEAIAQEASA